MLLIQTDKAQIRVFDMRAAASQVRSSGSDGPCRKFTIPAIEPWQMRLVVAE